MQLKEYLAELQGLLVNGHEDQRGVRLAIHDWIGQSAFDFLNKRKEEHKVFNGALNNVDVLYGATGTTKTSQLGWAALYWWKKTGKKSLLAVTDPGGTGSIQSLINEGIIGVWNIPNDRENLIWTFNKLTQGYWPEDVNDPNTRLIPIDLSGIACFMFDGVTSMADRMMNKFRAAVEMKVVNGQRVMVPTNIKVPEMPKDSYVFDEGIVEGGVSESYARRFLGRSDYGAVQSAQTEWITNWGFMGVPVIVTALEHRGEEEADGTKKPVYGPKFIGSALTGKCGNLFRNLIHMDLLPGTVDVRGDDGKVMKQDAMIPRMFLKNHFGKDDPMKIPYPAKVRAPMTLHHEVPFHMEPRLDKLYEMLDVLQEKEQGELGKMVKRGM